MFTELDHAMMHRALQLAECGAGFTSPNPMVGAVIVSESGEIIGEGYHRCWGGPHAEVNAVASVADRGALSSATIYVTLEPCSHYGKTPPCALLLKECGFRRVVIACADPFKEVSGRGIAMLREAGIEVQVGLLEQEARALNRRFIMAHTRRRPYVTLKWAETSDGYMAAGTDERLLISTPLTQVLMHRERAMADAILAGTDTLIADNPSLTCRLWPHRSLRPVLLDRHGRVPAACTVAQNPDTIRLSSPSLPQLLDELYTDHGISSLLVEGGATLMRSFLAEHLWDELRIERGACAAGSSGSLKAPQVSLSDVPIVEHAGTTRIFRGISAEVRNEFGDVLKGVKNT